jgi:hypothetical protein
MSELHHVWWDPLGARERALEKNGNKGFEVWDIDNERIVRPRKVSSSRRCVDLQRKDAVRTWPHKRNLLVDRRPSETHRKSRADDAPRLVSKYLHP